MSQEDKNSKLVWFEQLQKPLLSYAHGILKDVEESKEIVQESFLRFFQESASISFPKAWLYTTTRNLSISRLRKKQRLITTGKYDRQLDFFSDSGGKDQEHPREKMEKEEKIYRVKHAVSLLPQDIQDLLKMKFEQRMSYLEMAEKLGISVGNVGFKLHKVIYQLSIELKEENILE